MQQYSIACGLCIIFKYEEQSLLGITYGKSALCSQGEISSLEELMEPPWSDDRLGELFASFSSLEWPNSVREKIRRGIC